MAAADDSFDQVSGMLFKLSDCLQTSERAVHYINLSYQFIVESCLNFLLNSLNLVVCTNSALHMYTRF